MEKPMSEQELITYDDFVNWLETFKKEVYNWEDPSGNGELVWKDEYTGTNNSKDKNGSRKGNSSKQYYGLVPASFNEVRNMFKKTDYEFDYGTI